MDKMKEINLKEILKYEFLADVSIVIWLVSLT